MGGGQLRGEKRKGFTTKHAKGAKKKERIEGAILPRSTRSAQRGEQRAAAMRKKSEEGEDDAGWVG
jgi:hypothetical protein